MKTLKSFEFQNGSKNKYDWDKLLDGGIYELHRGADFSPSVINFRTMAYSAGSRRGLKVHVHEIKDGVVLQAYKPEETP